ncbi:MAG: phosphoribosylformylglycinamidine cyclo-ligase, partial [Halobacteriota archaeon]
VVARAGAIEVDGLRIGLTTDGVGTKLLVAQALDRYDTIGIDCIAMNVNDLVAEGLRPIGFVDYLALPEPDESLMAEIGIGLAAGANRADVELLGGETAIIPEVVRTFDLAGSAIGVADVDAGPSGEVTPGNVLVGIPSTGIHSNGLTLARKAIERSHEYADPFPDEPTRSIGEVLLEPTRIYTDVVPCFDRFDVHACAHVTGGGLRNVARMGPFRYVVDDPPAVPPIFPFVQSCGDIDDEEMYATFNMGLGFVLAVDAEEADDVAEACGGDVIGAVEAGDGVSIDGLELAS